MLYDIHHDSDSPRLLVMSGDNRELTPNQALQVPRATTGCEAGGVKPVPHEPLLRGIVQSGSVEV